jgi:hypothetical protein
MNQNITPKCRSWFRAVFRVAAIAFPLVLRAESEQQSPMDLGVFFTAPDSWSLTAETFMGQHATFGFRFVDGRQTVMSNQKEGLRFLGLPLYEARVYFTPEGVRRVELSIYNKGDAGVRDQEAFEAEVATVKEKLSAALQDTGMTGRTSSDRANYRIWRHQWTRKTPGVQLEWACVEPHRSGGQNVPYSAEFITVLLVPIRKGGGGMTAVTGGMTAARAKNARTIRENVVRAPEGDVRIDNVPMVDQGQKGYCAAAASERVLRYYGLQVDQHQIAQLADTAAEGGTTLEGMAKAIAKVGRQFQLDKKELIAPDAEVHFEKSEHLRLIEQYNVAARKRKAAMIEWKDFLTDNRVDLPAIWRTMDPAILLAARTSQRQAMNQFVRHIKTYTDQGVPLLWSCLVGLYPEDPPLGENGAFGHVRLILGYNEKNGEVLYSDSWGPRHALKRLPLDQAWAMTKGLIVLKPRGIR